MEKANPFRGIVLSKFRSVSEFANELGWNRQKAHRIIERKTKPSLEDCANMAKVLNTNISVVSQFFL